MTTKTLTIAALAALLCLPMLAQEKKPTVSQPGDYPMPKPGINADVTVPPRDVGRILPPYEKPILTAEDKLAIRDAQIQISVIKENIEALTTKKAEAEKALGETVKAVAERKCAGCLINQMGVNNELVLIVPATSKAETKPQNAAEHP